MPKRIQNKHSNDGSFLQSYNFKIPGWVDFISPEYKQIRKRITKKYGLITLISSVLLIMSIGIYNLVNRGNYYAIKRSKLLYRFPFTVGFVTKIISFCIAYTFLIALPENHHDLMFITKRLGRMAVTLMPSLFFLSLRPSPSPKTLYLTLIPVHKWVSRMVVMQSILHTILYSANYIHSNKTSKIWEIEQIYGWISLCAFLIITVTSFYPVRRKRFGVFYINHYLLSWVSVGFLYFHSRPPAKTATLLNIAILSYQIYSRLARTSLVRIHVHNLSSNLKIVEIPKSSIPKSKWGFKHSFLPFSHLRIQKRYSNPLKNFFYRFLAPLAHPYSLASLPSDQCLLLVVRHTNFELNDGEQYYITGSYESDLEVISVTDRGLNILKKGIPNNIVTLSSYYECSASRVLMVIGGSGISVALPLLRILNIHGIPSKIIWVIKDIEDLKLFKFFKNIDINSIEVFLTSKTYQFDHLRDNTLSLDDLFHDDTDSIDSEIHDSEIDFTNLDSKLEEHDPSFKNTLELSHTSPSRRLRRSRSSSPDCHSNQILADNRLEAKRSLRDIIIDNLNLDTYLEKANDDDDDDIVGSNADNVTINLSKNSRNYEQQIKHGSRRKSHIGSLYGAISDATESRSSSRTWRTNEEFKIPILFKPASNSGRFTGIVKHLKLYKGRPTLGQDEFHWCLNHICGDQDNEYGNFYQSTPLSSNSSLHQSSECQHIRHLHLDTILKRVWVFGVGPPGLTKKTREWAESYRLNFREESFSV